MEFITDQYVAWDVNYNLNGLILNQIPLIKALKLREIVSFRGFYGSLSDKNNPSRPHQGQQRQIQAQNRTEQLNA